jgi:hypothetical protein
MDKHQISSTKFQIISNEQSSKLQENSFCSFGIGAWNLFEIWDLQFGILEAKRFSLLPRK